MKRFKCVTCPKTGSLHTRCDHYFQVKEERDRVRKLRTDHYSTFIKTGFNYLSKEGV